MVIMDAHRYNVRKRVAIWGEEVKNISFSRKLPGSRSGKLRRVAQIEGDCNRGGGWGGEYYLRDGDVY